MPLTTRKPPGTTDQPGMDPKDISLFQNLGEYEKALEYYMKALAIREKVLGREHPDTATTYNNIGVLYYYMQDYVEAKQYLQKAYFILAKIFGNEHPYTKKSNESVEIVMKKLGELSTQ